MVESNEMRSVVRTRMQCLRVWRRDDSGGRQGARVPECRVRGAGVTAATVAIQRYPGLALGGNGANNAGEARVRGRPSFS